MCTHMNSSIRSSYFTSNYLLMFLLWHFFFLAFIHHCLFVCLFAFSFFFFLSFFPIYFFVIFYILTFNGLISKTSFFSFLLCSCFCFVGFCKLFLFVYLFVLRGFFIILCFGNIKDAHQNPTNGPSTPFATPLHTRFHHPSEVTLTCMCQTATLPSSSVLSFIRFKTFRF